MKIKKVINGTILIAIFINAVAFNSCEDKAREIKAPEGTITLKEAHQLEQRYIKTRHSIINKALGFDGYKMQDSREVWFSLERMKEYIKYVEATADKEGYKELGLRFYFGVYPDTNENIGYTTLFAVPTTTSIPGGKSHIQSNLVPTSDHEKSENMQNAKALNLGGSGHPPKNVLAQ
ncbi:hypothetical protein [Aquimarina agarivorans]|uniref:hypothetical protein n=1 Tax=Aquimarina agarivorans TaxID=980584 RepID=UPI000248EFF7|nr:hypothetical protein [Aquimarina agarivorans]